MVTRLNLQVAAFRRKYLSNHGVAEAVTLATLTAMFGYFNRFLRLDMTESLFVLFRECEGGGDYHHLCQYVHIFEFTHPSLNTSSRSGAQWRMVNSLLLATVFRTFLVIISYGCKVPAGIFVPSMAIGASFGRMVGIFVKAIHMYAVTHKIMVCFNKSNHREYPQSGWFAVCDPNIPCITPGAYALLGAGAALRRVTLYRFIPTINRL